MRRKKLSRKCQAVRVHWVQAARWRQHVAPRVLSSDMIDMVQGSQRTLTHVGREQVRLLNKWTRAMAHRVALESDSPTATTAPVTLAAAEAPFADPFLMEFEDPEALKSAYSETPMTFEQALMTARLEAKMATQVCTPITRASMSFGMPQCKKPIQTVLEGL